MVSQEIIKSDLSTLDSKEFYLKHIVKSHNWYLSDYLHTPQNEIIDKMDYFKEIVSTNFGINFHNCQIVGSAKTGFSLSPNKLLKPFHEETPSTNSSDIDIAIISDQLYTEYWSALRQEKTIHAPFNKTYYNRIAASIFRGYINEKDLIRFQGIKKKWSKLISPANVQLQDNLGFIHPITYRLYRSWDDLEEYQLIGITKAKSKMEESLNV
ncbi:MAG: hypothetical protein MJ077_03260 [Oscillospiraceae bacterium]|nr:hypothetical protein [Oscillospiraceae bacterium]